MKSNATIRSLLIGILIVLYVTFFRPYIDHDVTPNIDAEILIGLSITLIACASPLISSRLKFFFFRNQIDNRRRLAINWLLSTQIKWSNTYFGSERKILNTAEGLSAIIFNNETDHELTANVLEFIFGNISDKGVISNTFNSESVQATSVTLYYLLKLKEKKNFTFTSEQISKIEQLVKSLVTSSSEYGWGTLNKKEFNDNLRITTTLWSLRALNLYYTSDSANSQVESILKAIVKRVPNKLFGFNFYDSEKATSVALFLILLRELKNNNLRKELLSKKETRSLSRFLFHSLISEPNFIEHESFAVDPSYFGGIERLDFHHVSIAFIITALSYYFDELTLKEQLLYKRKIRKILKDNFYEENERGYFIFNSLNSHKYNYLIYPTTYMTESLYSIVN